MQIRMALGQPLLMDKRYTKPLYDTFMLGLPHLYREMNDYPIGDTIKISISGKLNKSWYLVKKNGKWMFCSKIDSKPISEVKISENDAWIIFTNTD